ncbi:universal stress protein [Actinoplanes awajinensis]|uniref:UspA domain-containing protein n=1 Tax=Actinoplanes awajinensis subsp. mycoplanecinus TaxID=135947 RepID=A0A0X3V990_9ACTN|nr:universal stress protein [Actinoplanes awajinensis]KUL41345.1 hypothetical protein ADL15_03555 [Actinoplanes awajinensis subsp. mycoplanecinus]
MGDQRTVVVGVDGTTTSSITVDLAVAEAVRRSARLLIVHVWPGRYRGRFRPGRTGGDLVEGRQLLAGAARRAAAIAPGLVVDTALRTGVAAESLAECSAEAGLIVIGHRDAKLGRSDWGTTARLLARTSASPLLVHRGHAGMPGPIVVGVSGRPAEPALGYAFVQAALSGADLVAVRAWQRPPERRDRHPLPVVGDLERRVAAESLIAALAGWSRRLPQVSAEPLVVPDLDVPYTLDRASRRGRLLIAGTGGRGELTDLLRGPAARTGAHERRCPVLLVPPHWQVELAADPVPA